MPKLRPKLAAIVVSSLLLAAVLGATAGIAAAGSRSTLYPGLNLVGGPLYDSLPPQDYLACLPSGSWRAIYLWDAATQTWQHYFNTSLGIPSYVNRTDLGGIQLIPQAAGLWIIMVQQVNNPKVKDLASESCS